jgi:hypothetical protein
MQAFYETPSQFCAKGFRRLDASGTSVSDVICEGHTGGPCDPKRCQPGSGDDKGVYSFGSADVFTVNIDPANVSSMNSWPYRAAPYFEPAGKGVQPISKNSDFSDGIVISYKFKTNNFDQLGLHGGNIDDYVKLCMMEDGHNILSLVPSEKKFIFFNESDGKDAKNYGEFDFEDDTWYYVTLTLTLNSPAEVRILNSKTGKKGVFKNSVDSNQKIYVNTVRWFMIGAYIWSNPSAKVSIDHSEIHYDPLSSSCRSQCYAEPTRRNLRGLSQQGMCVWDAANINDPLPDPTNDDNSWCNATQDRCEHNCNGKFWVTGSGSGRSIVNFSDTPLPSEDPAPSKCIWDTNKLDLWEAEFNSNFDKAFQTFKEDEKDWCNQTADNCKVCANNGIKGQETLSVYYATVSDEKFEYEIIYDGSHYTTTPAPMTTTLTTTPRPDQCQPASEL